MLTSKQLYWEDIEVGSEIPPLAKVATTQMLVKWAGASGDFSPLHYDDAFAVSQGVGKPIVHGQLKQAWLIQLLTDWLGEDGFLKRFACQVRAMDYPRPMKDLSLPAEGETWWCKGKVISKSVADGEHCAACEVWIENGQGKVTTLGSATVVLPSNPRERL